MDDVAALALAVRDGETIDAAGPEIFEYRELVRLIRAAVHSRARLVHVPPDLAIAALAPISAVLRDVVLTREELAGLMSELLYVERSTASRSFREYLAGAGAGLGARYLHELARHFARSRTARAGAGS